MAPLRTTGKQRDVALEFDAYKVIFYPIVINVSTFFNFVFMEKTVRFVTSSPETQSFAECGCLHILQVRGPSLIKASVDNTVRTFDFYI
jgi:hypothetical protein